MTDRIKINRLKSLIREVGVMFGEQQEFLKSYIDEQVSTYKDQIDEAIDCFLYLKSQGEALGSTIGANVRPSISKPRKVEYGASIGPEKGNATYNGEVGWVLQRPFVRP